MQNDCTITPATISAAAADLLIRCARLNLNASQAGGIRRVVSDAEIDWNSLVAMALDHGVAPLLYRGLNRSCPDLIPPAVAETLASHTQGNTRHNLLLMRELLSLLSSMQSAGVHILPYKGPLLALTAYGDLSLRQCGDLDVLVPLNDIPAAKTVLSQRGYASNDLGDPSEAAAFESSAHEYHYSYIRDNPETMVELHWKVVGRFFSFDPDPLELWNRAAIQQVAGAEIRVLQPEDLLLILCAHGAKHFWSRLTWICDIAQFLNAHPLLNWQTVLQRAEQYDAKGMLLLALLLAETILEIQLPAAVMAEVSDTHLKQASEIQGRLFLRAEQPDEVPKGARMQLTEGGLFQSLVFQFRIRERWTGGLRYCFYRALAPTHVDKTWMQLPKQLSFGYYAIRPLRLFIKYSLRPLGRIIGWPNPATPPVEQMAGCP